MRHSAKQDRETVETRELRNKALELRKRGYNFRQIAQALDITVSSAHKTVQVAIAEIPRDNAIDVRLLELERVDRMLDAIWDAATSGDVRAIDTALRLMERRAKYLGLDAPVKAELTGKDGEPLEIQLRPVIMIPPERVNGSSERHLGSNGAPESPSGLDPKPGPTN